MWWWRLWRRVGPVDVEGRGQGSGLGQILQIVVDIAVSTEQVSEQLPVSVGEPGFGDSLEVE